MPELPEVRAHAERLTEAFGGAVLQKFVPISFTALKTYAPAPDVAYGSPLLRVDQRGKYLALVFEPATFVVHLMQGGRLKPDEKQAAKPKGALARWVFEDGRALLLSEMGTEKRAGVWVVEALTEGEEPIAHLGPDADSLDAAGIAERIGDENKRLHGVLRDQHPMAGIGRRLANEVTHAAKLSPFAKASKLTDEEIGRLHAAIQDKVAEGLAYERTRDDMSASKDRPGAVHHRKGETCPVCGDTVREVAYVKYTVNYCPTCQTDGKILADNTTSKFLK
jgi:formamidopyrimidine-DNA glycosylase